MSITVRVPELNPTKHQGRRWLSRVIAFLYGLVMFEVVIMVSPFAFYFYAAYGPTLKWLNTSAATAWLTGFLLPHAVSTDSWFLEFLRWDLGRYAFGLGFLSFLVLAAQIYGSKLLGRKMVNSGVYRYIRHPQYLSLTISAFGLFTAWPRVIIFFLFIGMLFAYYFLARVEERRMLAVDASYAEYMRHTGMFLPGNPGGRLSQFAQNHYSGNLGCPFSTSARNEGCPDLYRNAHHPGGGRELLHSAMLTDVCTRATGAANPTKLQLSAPSGSSFCTPKPFCRKYFLQT